MEITNEIKAKVFAQYLTRTVSYQVPGYGVQLVSLNGIFDDYFFDHSVRIPFLLEHAKLNLRPLSAITDEEKVQVARFKKASNGASTDDAPRTFKGLLEYGTGIIITKSYCHMGGQYLQSIGVDVPHYLLGGKTLKEVGLAIYEAEKVA